MLEYMTLREKQLTVGAAQPGSSGREQWTGADPLLEAVVDDVEAVLLSNSPEESREAVAEMMLSQRTRGPTAFSEW